MEIYVVQPNDTINSIADKYKVSVNKLIRDNELLTPYNLIPGQTIVIVYPKQTYIVKEGDTLESIALNNGITQMQLLRNNPFLSNHPIYAGEILTISYNTTGKITTGGYIYPYINQDTLKKTLPSLTYLTIYNYRSVGEGKIISYFDDTQVIQLAKEYGAIPLLLATTISPQGESDIETAFSILLNEEFQDIHINQMLSIIRDKGYLGVNIVFYYMNTNNMFLYEKFIIKIDNILKKEGYFLFVTINPNIKYIKNELTFDKIDYKGISQAVSEINFLQFIWGTNYGPPVPVNSINQLKTFLDYAITNIPSTKICIGNSLISYDWQLPYIPGSSFANSQSLNSALRLAQETGAVIQFDEVSKSPYFTYIQTDLYEHIVWSVDARSIYALVQLIMQYNLRGASFWNLMTYTAQLWLVINSQFEIEKLIPNKFD